MLPCYCSFEDHYKQEENEHDETNLRFAFGTGDGAGAVREVLDVSSDDWLEYCEASYVLTADIAINDVSDFDSWGTKEPAYQWAPIHSFHGSFDGDGHTISGLYLFKVGDEYRDMGLFDGTNTGAVIRDLHLTQAYLFMDGTDSATMDVGCLVGNAYGATIENCTVEGVVRVQNGGSYSLGGVVGWAQQSAISGCRFTGTVEGQSFGGAFGGVAGTTTGYWENCLLTDCVSEGTMQFTDSAQGAVGGVVGSASGVVRGCVNRMDISGDCDELGGVMGRVSVGAETLNEETAPGSFAAYDCRNEGAVENPVEEAGGVIGIVHNSDARVENLTLSGLVNSGTVTGVERVGGIIGDLGSGCLTYTLENCENTGTVTGGPYAGGMIGYLSSSSFGSGTRDFAADTALEEEALQSAAVDPTTMDDSDYQTSLEERAIHALGGSCVGGIAGKLWLGAIEDCTVSGTILLDEEDVAFVGGIAGQFYNVGDEASSSLIANCQYRQGWPYPAMAAIGTLENLPEEAIVNVTASLSGD